MTGEMQSTAGGRGQMHLTADELPAVQTLA